MIRGPKSPLVYLSSRTGELDASRQVLTALEARNGHVGEDTPDYISLVLALAVQGLVTR